MLEGKKAYICSPLSAPDPEGIRRNMAWARYYLQMIREKYHCRTFASHAHLPLMLDDHIPEEREAGLLVGRILLGLCDVLIICGPVISSGMEAEIREAYEKGLKVYWYDSPANPRGLLQYRSWKEIEDEMQI